MSYGPCLPVNTANLILPMLKLPVSDYLDCQYSSAVVRVQKPVSIRMWILVVRISTGVEDHVAVGVEGHGRGRPGHQPVLLVAAGRPKDRNTKRQKSAKLMQF